MKEDFPRKSMILKQQNRYYIKIRRFKIGCLRNMSLDVEGFTDDIDGAEVTIKISSEHRLLKLARQLPWEEMLEAVLPDLKSTEKSFWWVGRPLRIRIHLGIYVLQQMFNLTDRDSEHQLRDNAAFRLFCGFGLVKKWHVPDHTKIASFRSRLSAETQRKLANMLSVKAVKLGYANPSQLDVDSTVQEANISYPSMVSLLIKVAILAKTAAKALNKCCYHGEEVFHIKLSYLKQLAFYYFRLKRKGCDDKILKVTQRRLWSEVYSEILPVLNHIHQLGDKLNQGKYWSIRQAVERLRWRGCQFMEQTHAWLFEAINSPKICALHAYEVGCFNKGKLNKRLEFGRAYQLGRIGGNFLFVGQCSNLFMPDAASLPAMIREHQKLFGEGCLKSIATDKGYYSRANKKMLADAGVDNIYLPRPEGILNATPDKIPATVQKLLHNRRAGIEPLIGHTKQNGQMGRSRMKSDETTKSAGYASVLGFNLRQLMRYALGEVRPENENKNKYNTKRTTVVG